MITLLAWAGSAAVILTYALWAVWEKPGRWFNIANALGGIPLIAANIVVGAWYAVPLSALFTLVGWVGWLKGTDD